MTQSAVAVKHLGSGREQKTDGLWKHLGAIDGGALRIGNQLLVPTGAGTEIGYQISPPLGFIQAYDRDLNVYRDLTVQAKNLNLYAQAGGSVNLSGPVHVSGGLDSVQNLPGTGIATPGDISVNRGNNTGAVYFVDNSHYLFWDGTQFVLNGGKLQLNTPASIRTQDLASGAAQQQLGSYIAALTQSTAVTGQWLVSSMTTPAVACSGVLTRFEVTTFVWHSAANAIIMLGVGMDGAATWPSLAMTGCPVAGQPYLMTFTYYATPPAGTHTFSVLYYNVSAGTANLGHTWAYSTFYVTEQKR